MGGIFQTIRIMIEALIKPLSQRIKQLGWVDTYGGLVERFEQTHERAEDVYIVKSYPVSREIENACQPGYNDLYPNTNSKSVVYIEDRSGLKLERITGSKGRISEYTCDLRLVVWANGYKIAEDDKRIGLISDCIKASKIDLHPKNNEELKRLGVLRLQMYAGGTVLYDKRQVFDRYSYEKEDAPFLHPHVFFAIPIKLHARIYTNCILPYQHKNASLCHNIF